MNPALTPVENRATRVNGITHSTTRRLDSSRESADSIAGRRGVRFTCGEAFETGQRQPRHGLAVILVLACRENHGLVWRSHEETSPARS